MWHRCTQLGSCQINPHPSYIANMLHIFLTNYVYVGLQSYKVCVIVNYNQRHMLEYTRYSYKGEENCVVRVRAVLSCPSRSRAALLLRLLQH